MPTINVDSTQPSTAIGRPVAAPPLLRTFGHADALPAAAPAPALLARRWLTADEVVPATHPVRQRSATGTRAPPPLPAPVVR